ncbi:MAG: type II toxin-antitoxin system PemK/MazF family toxin [Desulfocucumaceae bacterium]
MTFRRDRVYLYLDWVKQKLLLDARSTTAKKRIVIRGQVYKCHLGRGVGQEEEKERPCVILQNDSQNKNSPNTIVAPITRTTSTINVVVPIVTQYNSDDSILFEGNVLLGNIVTVSKARLGDYVTEISKPEMKKIDEALLISVGLIDKFISLEQIIKDKDKYIKILKNKLSEIDSNNN